MKNVISQSTSKYKIGKKYDLFFRDNSLLTVDDLYSMYIKFNEMSKNQKEEFIERRKNIVASGNFVNYDVLKTSGTTGKIKQYKWGPNFLVHHAFYDRIFFPKPYIYAKIFYSYFNDIDEISSSSEKNFLLKISKNDFGEVKKITNKCIVCDPDTFIIAQKKRDFVNKFFDIETCIFCFTGTSTTQSHIDVFNYAKINYRDYMRSWDGGATFFTCEYGNKHWIDFASEIKVKNNNLISTDLWNEAQKHINYWNGDVVKWSRGKRCRCGLSIDDISMEKRTKTFEVFGNIFHYDVLLGMFSQFFNFSYLVVAYNKNTICLIGDFEITNGKQNKWNEFIAKNFAFKSFELLDIRMAYLDCPLIGPYKMKCSIELDDSILRKDGFSILSKTGNIKNSENIRKAFEENNNQIWR